MRIIFHGQKLLVFTVVLYIYYLLFSRWIMCTAFHCIRLIDCPVCFDLVEGDFVADEKRKVNAKQERNKRSSECTLYTEQKYI